MFTAIFFFNFVPFLDNFAVSNDAQCSPEVLSSVPKDKKAVMCLSEKRT